MGELLNKIDESKLSPMMKHYKSLKAQYADCIILFRLGDFYEMFFDDALIASKVLDITLTGRDCGLEERAPMCGVPYHAVDNYIAKLVAADLKVAICEQLSVPGVGKGMVDRDVIRVISAGTIVEDNILDGAKNNYLASIYVDNACYAISWVDISTGEFFATQNQFDVIKLANILSSIAPSEVICNKEFLAYSDGIKQTYSSFSCKPFVYYDWAYSLNGARALLEKQLNTVSLKAFYLQDKEGAIRACGALLEYLKETGKRTLTHLKRISYVADSSFMIIDANTRANLELVEALRTKKTKGSLLSAIDFTACNMGARLLRKWLEQPLTSQKQIVMRQDAVEELIDKTAYADVKEALSGVRDLERLLAKVVFNSVNPQNLLSIMETLNVIPSLKLILDGCNSKMLSAINAKLYPLKDLATLLFNAIRPDAPSLQSAGGFIKKGFDKQLDEYLDAKENGKQWLAQLEANEKESTGIKTLKVGFNKVFGYYIEVTKSAISQVPYNYVRKQTLANGERYITEELKYIEDKLTSAEELSGKLELQLFEKLKGAILAQSDKLQEICRAIASLDALNSLSIAAVKFRYVRPIVSEKSKTISITQLRHPVVSQLMPANEFIENDVLLDGKENNILILTGPNMSGKSTYMKSVALIVLLAQIGSFVPAKHAEIAITDRIFTRIGASDDMLNNQSTFMVEMLEVAEIMNCATDKSLLILDEVGRGTSTYDGLSIAWAIIEHISKNIHAKTLFATHYHEITELESKLDGVKNYKVLVDESGKDIVFLHKIARGPASRSFGIEVAGMAGIPPIIIRRAQEISASLDNYRKDIDIQAIINGNKQMKTTSFQPSLLDEDDKIRNILRDIDINNCSPVQALIMLTDLIILAKE